MMSLNFSVGFSICIILLCILILLYMHAPEIFFIRMHVRTKKFIYMLQDRFTKEGKANREKWRKLSTTIQFCETAISKYVNKENLSTLKKDETLKNLLILYRELLDIEAKNDSDFSEEQIHDIWVKVEELYFPDLDPYYNHDIEDFV